MKRNTTKNKNLIILQIKKEKKRNTQKKKIIYQNERTQQQEKIWSSTIISGRKIQIYQIKNQKKLIFSYYTIHLPRVNVPTIR